MKRVIEGKLYNTETAEKLHSWSNGRGKDFSGCEEILYKTKKGAYFIAGSGGSMTKYARSESIEVLSKTETIRWLETHGGTECIEKHFPDMIKEA